MKKILLTGLTGIFVAVQVQAQWVHDWSRALGGTSSEQGQCITSDANNYSISSGVFNGTGDFDPGPGTHSLVSAGASDMYIEKLSNSGTLMWARQVGGTGVEVPESITLIPGGGDVFVCGRFSGTTDFNYGGSPAVKTSVGGDDIFIARYDVLTGNLVWVYTFGSTGTDQAWDIMYEGNQLLVCGTVQGKVTFNNYTVNTTGGSKDAFIMRMTTSGSISWIKNFGGTGTDIAYGICTDYTTYVYTCGTFEGTANFDPAGTYNIAATGTQDMFCSRYTLAAGAFSTWAWGAGTVTGVQRAKDIAYSLVTGNIYLTGTVSVGTITWPNSGAITYPIAGNTDGFLLCYDPSGNYVWGSGFGSTGADEGTDIACDQSTANPDAYVYVCGNFTNTVDFDFGGTANVTSHGMLDFFMLRYNGSGTFKDVAGIGSLGRDACYGICANQTMQFIYVTGFYTGTVDMDPDPANTVSLAGMGFSDIYHNRYSWTAPVRLMNPALAENDGTVRAYPNPASGIMYIDNLEQGSAVEMYSADGKLVLKQAAETEGQLAIDLSDFENGFYLLRITSPDGAVKTGRIVVQH